MMRNKKNMTLLELLTAIIIIGVVASLIFPSLRKAREAAYKTDCTNNLHQISMAYIMYQDDWGVYPDSGYMLDDFTPVYEYINNLEVFNCKGSDTYHPSQESHLNGATDYLRNGEYNITDAQVGINWELKEKDTMWNERIAVAFANYYSNNMFSKLEELLFKAVEDNPYNIQDADALAIALMGEGVFDRDINNHGKINFVAMDGTYSELSSNLNLWQIDDNGNAVAGKGNNGHGNNEDGVDSSNPGQGDGGPNGAEDSDPNVDDEIKGGGKSGKGNK